MRLATAQDVLNTLSLQNRGSNDDAADEGLEQTTPIIEHVLGTSVARADRQDIFCIDKLWERNSSGGFFAGTVKLLLEAGFVCPDASIRVTVFSDFQDAIAGNGEKASKDIIFLDAEEGVLKTVALIGEWVQVRYTAGFTEKDGTYEGVPNWTKRAAVSAAIRYMRAFQAKWNAKDIRDTKEEIHRMMEMHLTAKIRTKYGTYPYHAKELN